MFLYGSVLQTETKNVCCFSNSNKSGFDRFQVKQRYSVGFTVSSANPATLEGYGLYRLPDGLIAPIPFKIGEELVHKYRNKSQFAGSTKFE